MGDKVLSVKERCSAHVDNTPASEIKLIYRGKILNNDDTVQASKLESGSTLHLVKSKPAGGNTQPTGQTGVNMTAPVNNLQQPTTTNTNASQQQNPLGGLGGLGGMGGLGGLGGLGGMPGGMGGMPGGMDPAMAQQLMQNPMVRAQMQQLFSNPE